MRICTGLLCDNTADLMGRGKPWCTACFIKRFGIAPSSGNPFPGGAVQGTPSSEGFPSSGEARPAGSLDRPEPPPLNLTWDELAEILRAERQWWEVEHDLKVLHGMTLNDLAARLETELTA